jgi:hypothetical protein
MIKSLRLASKEELLNEIDKCLENDGTNFFLKAIIYQNELIRRGIKG